MINYKKDIKIIGFDLDQTLYPKSPEIDQAIQGYIYKKIADYKNCSIEEAKKMFNDLYKDGKGLSGSKTLRALGILNGTEIVQEALENADITKFLYPNEKVINLLKEIKNQYNNIDLITGSGEKIAIKKLESLNISLSLFNNFIHKDICSKSDGTAYELWLSFYKKYLPSEFLYIGDRVKSDFEVPNNFGINSILVNIKNLDESVGCPQLKSFEDLKDVLI